MLKKDTCLAAEEDVFSLKKTTCLPAVEENVFLFKENTCLLVEEENMSAS